MIFWISGQWSLQPRVLIQLDVLCVHVGPGSVRAALQNTSRMPGGYRGGTHPIPLIVISRRSYTVLTQGSAASRVSFP
jgi:hypothetical protein